MKKFLLVLVMCLVSFAVVAAQYGVGSPAGVTPNAIGEIYQNTSTGQLFKANSTTKGDWSKLPPVMADGSVNAPVTMITFTPSNWPVNPATGSVFLASSSLELMMYRNATWTVLP